LTLLRWLLLSYRVWRLGPQVPLRGIVAILDTLEEGRNGKYSADPLRWRRQTPHEHYLHAIQHFELWEDQDASEPHLEHWVTRAAFACETGLKEVG
jgi:hypothetical protein